MIRADRHISGDGISRGLGEKGSALSKISGFNIATVTSVALMFAGCDGVDQTEGPSPKQSMLMEIQSADEAWRELTSSGWRAERQEGDDAFLHFLREVELTAVRRRDLGLDFWNQHPEDPRRYKWLQLTVHLPPHYAVDIHEWSVNESYLAPNIAPINHAALAEWEKLYPRLRQEFWGSPDVTDKQRRFLWMGELEQKIRRANEADARGEPVDAEAILTDILAFAKTYPEPFNEIDVLPFYSGVQKLIGLVTGDDRETFGLTGDSLMAYAKALVETGNRSAVARGTSIQTALEENDGELPPIYPADITETERAWRSLPSYPGDQPSSFEEYVVFFHDQIVNMRKYRDIGVRRLWNEYPDRKWRRIWMLVTLSEPPTYAKDFVDAIHAKAEDRLAYVEEDQVAKAEWESQYELFRAEIWNDPETSDKERGEIRGKEIWTDLWAGQAAWERHRDKSVVQRLLNDIHSLYADYGNARDTWTYSTVILRAHKDYGLDDGELLAFFKPMETYSDEDLRILAEAAKHQIGLRTSPFEFTATTLRDDSFDIADMRGRIVLIDHWATTCASCIEAMPRIHDVYERYKDSGFEVVSIAYDGTSQRRRIERIETELGLTWTTLNAEGQWEDISEKYGYQGFPQYMLLNRDGTLYAGTGEVDMGRNLEALLEEMLAAETDAATRH